MHSHALTYPVADLVRKQVRAVREQARAPLPAWLLRFASPFSRFAARKIEKQAWRISDKAVWFQGATSRIPSEPADTPMDSDGTLLQSLEDLEKSMLDMRRDALALIAEFEKIDGERNGPVRDAFRRVASASADAFEAVQAFRWAMMEHDAQADIAAGRVSQAYTSADELLAALNAD